MALTAPQEQFCREYVSAKFNATLAYRRAYPKTKTDKAAQAAGSRLLSNVMVQERVAALVAAAASTAGIDPARVIRELGFVAFQRASQLYRPDGTFKDPGEWDEATDATIAGVESEEEYAAEGEEQEPQPHGGTLKRSRGKVTCTRTVKVKRWDKVRALELFMKHFGLFKEDAPHPDRPRLDLSSIPDELKRALLDALRAARKS